MAGVARPGYMKLREKMPQGIAAFAVYTLLFGSVFGMLALVFPTLSESIYYLMNHLDEIINQVIDVFHSSWIKEWIKSGGVEIQNLLERTTMQFRNISGKIGMYGLPIGVSVLLSYYFLTQWDKITKASLRLFPESNREDVIILSRRIADVLSGFFRSRILLMFFMSAITYVFFRLFNIRGALAFALFAGVSDLIPYIGAALGGVFPVTFLFTVSIKEAIILLILLTMLQLAENAWLAPKLTGDAVYMHPAVVVFLVFAGGHLFGFWGVLFAVPFGAIVRTVFEYYLEKIT